MSLIHRALAQSDWGRESFLNADRGLTVSFILIYRQEIYRLGEADSIGEPDWSFQDDDSN
jgi:hypothetical protein